jgi:transposase
MPVELPDADRRWRCGQCGNLTRFDVTSTRRVREFWHLDLSGRPVVQDSEVLSVTVEKVSCRWCGAHDAVQVVPRPQASAVPGGLPAPEDSAGPRGAVGPAL